MTSPATERRDGSKDFDFLIGRWTTRNRKLVKPLSGDDTWESFEGGVGLLHSRELWEGRPILVRYQWIDITPRSARWQQAFSPDDGASWEVNWIADHTRVGA